MKKPLIIILSLGIIVALIYFTQQAPKQVVASAKVVRAPITQILSVEGKTHIKQRYQLTAPVVGELSRVNLDVGDYVTRGQVVAEIRPTTPALLDVRSHRQAQASIAAAQARLESAKQRSVALKAAASLANQELARLQPLLAIQAVSQQQYERAQAQKQRSQAEYTAAQSEEIEAKANLEAAYAQLQTGDNRSEEGVLAITSPTDGRLIHLELESAQPVSAGQVIMEIGDPRALEIQADVLSSEAILLSPDMKAQVLHWGGHPLEATLTRISPSGYTKTSALGIEEQRTDVFFDINSPYKQWQNLGDGYRVDLDITIQSLDDALQIPLGALFRSDEGWAVYRIDEGRAKLNPVAIGIKSKDYVQIVQGLAEGDRVIVQPDNSIQQGSRVQGES